MRGCGHLLKAVGPLSDESLSYEYRACYVEAAPYTAIPKKTPPSNFIDQNIDLYKYELLLARLYMSHLNIFG